MRGSGAGELAAYIPEPAAADPDLLALAVVGPRGRVVALGDADAEFTIPSMSKPFVFALALETLGRDRNRAFGHLLRSYDLVRGDVSDAVEAYFRQCSVRVTVADVAVMAGTLASAR